MNRNDPSPKPVESATIDTSQNFSKDKKKRTKKIVPEKVKHDENCFVIGVFNLMFCTFLISAFPWMYWIWHSAKMMTLLLYRLHKFSKIKFQYFLLDFCYTANYWSIFYFAICILKSKFKILEPLNVLFNPWGNMIFRVLFTWCVGPLAMSIAFFRNSLVFHSSDQIIILATHLSPNLAIYGMKWWAADLEAQFPNAFHIACETSIKTILTTEKFSVFNSGSKCDASFSSIFTVPLFCYFILWTIPYAYFFFIYGRKKLEEGGYHTMYSTMKENPTMKMVLSKGGDSLQPVIYMFIHGFLCGISFLIAPVVWNSFVLHTAYLLILLFVSVKNAGTYYFEIFAERYYKTNIEKAMEKADQ